MERLVVVLVIALVLGGLTITVDAAAAALIGGTAFMLCNIDERLEVSVKVSMPSSSTVPTTAYA